MTLIILFAAGASLAWLAFRLCRSIDRDFS
jgi:hypothetical protein